MMRGVLMAAAALLLACTAAQAQKHVTLNEALRKRDLKWRVRKVSGRYAEIYEVS